MFLRALAFCHFLSNPEYLRKQKTKKQETYPAAQTQPLIQGEDGAQVKFMARFAHVVSQFTPPAGNSGSGNLQSKYTFPSGQA